MKNQVQPCEQVVNETFQHFFKAKNVSKPNATHFSLVTLFSKNQVQPCEQIVPEAFQHFLKVKMYQNIMPQFLHL